MITKTTLRRSLIFAAILSGLYFSVVAITAIDIYKNRITNWWTDGVEHIFPYPAAVAKHQIIPLSRFRREVAALQAADSTKKSSTTKKEIERTVIDRLVNNVLFENSLKDHKIAITEEDVDKTLENFYKQIGGKNNFDTFLRDEYNGHMDADGFRLLTRAYLTQSAIEKQVLVNSTVRHILIAAPESATPEQVEAAKRKAEDVKSKITDPSKFAEIAKQYSEDLASRDKGGDLGTTPRGDVRTNFSTDFENALFTSKVGEVVGPVRSKLGWHLLIVDKREGSVDKSLDAFTTELRKDPSVRIFIGT